MLLICWSLQKHMVPRFEADRCDRWVLASLIPEGLLRKVQRGLAPGAVERSHPALFESFIVERLHLGGCPMLVE